MYVYRPVVRPLCSFAATPLVATGLVTARKQKQLVEVA